MEERQALAQEWREAGLAGEEVVDRLRSLREIPAYGDKMSMEDFIAHSMFGELTNYDGQGHYATDTFMSNRVVAPSDAECGNVEEEWDFVIWFNR
jgi:hypothetical protein